MNRCFYPKPFPKESIASVALRACGADTITLSSLMKNFGGPTHNVYSLFIPVLRSEKTALHSLARLEDWQPPKPHRVLLESGSFIKWIDFGNGRFCSECARDGALPWMHDFNIISVCQRHRMTFVTHCKKCERKLSWNRRGLNICICGNELKGGKHASNHQLARNAHIEKLIVSLQFDRLSKILEVEENFSQRYNFAVELDKIDAFVSGNIEAIEPIFKKLTIQLGNLPPRAAVAPLRSCGKWIEPFVDNLVMKLSQHFSVSNKDFQLTSFYLTRGELAYTLATSPTIAGSIQRFLQSAGANTRGVVSGGALSELFAKLIPTYSKFNGLSAQRLEMTSSTAIEEVLAGRLRITDFDPMKPLREARFSRVTKNSGEFTIAQAASELNTYYEAIRHLGRVGLLRLERRESRYSIGADQLNQFRDSYILIGEITKQLETKDKRLSEKIMACGTKPVSGPIIDGGLIYIFRRRDIEKLNLHKVLATTDYVTHSGRKPLATKENLETKYLDGTAVATKLGISIQRLSQFENAKLLQRVHPAQGATRLRYYSRCSVNRTEKFIATLVPVRDIEHQAKMNSKKFRARCRALADHPLFRMSGSTRCISRDLANKALHHTEKFWDADSAAKYLGVGMCDIQNWRRLGHLTPLKNGAAGFVPELMLYRRESIEAFAHSHVIKQRSTTIRRKQLRH